MDDRSGGPSRRRFWRFCARSLLGVSFFLSGCATRIGPTGPGAARFPEQTCPPTQGGDEYDYIVVGSGAGGGPLACNLATAGYRVLLLEAGGEEEPFDYQVPVFHAQASEDDDLRWSFYVRHYADDARQRRDTKFVDAIDGAERNGILYPRAGTLGGCTAHNALIMIYPHNSDWDHIAELTGDASWRSDNMRTYFERLERCQYVKPSAGSDPSRHGFDGWITTNVANPTLLVGDQDLKTLVKATLQQAGQAFIRNLDELAGRLIARLENHFDPNDWRAVTKSLEGICLTPLTTFEGARIGSREFVRRVQRGCPQNLTVRTHALATRVLLDENNRAAGVEYLDGPHLYRADPKAPLSGGITAPRRTVNARREVILAGGAFNTPQLLMLSGIGPQAELIKHGITVRVDAPGVGQNLQDRYEVGVVSEMKRDLALLKGATFRAPQPGQEPDPQFRDWEKGRGVYTTNGAIIAIAKRSAPSRPEPDLYLFGLAGFFKGYEPGYSKRIARDKNYFTWAVLKAHTRNTAGSVTLRTNDPRDPPAINFRYFDEGNDASGEDLESVVAGVQFVREISARASDLIQGEIVPGLSVRTKEEIAQFVKDNAWGHHASCTCKIGPRQDPMAVLDSNFRVHGTRNLRVVDASVFPRIPGFFIVSAVYMISEKASEVILADAKANRPA